MCARDVCQARHTDILDLRLHGCFMAVLRHGKSILLINLVRCTRRLLSGSSLSVAWRNWVIVVIFHVCAGQCGLYSVIGLAAHIDRERLCRTPLAKKKEKKKKTRPPLNTPS